MPTYRYEAIRTGGPKAEGIIEAADHARAVAQIRQSYDVVLRLEEISAPRRDPLERFQKPNLKALALLCRQFSILLKAGLPLSQTVDLVTAQLEDKQLRQIFSQVREDIANGWSLSYSLMQRGRTLLPATLIATVRAGEDSGEMEQAFERMASYYERMSKTRSRAISALIYPSFLLVAAILVIMVIMTFAVPSFVSAFESMDMVLPLPTRIVVGISNFFTNHLWILLGLGAAGGLFLAVYGNTPSGRLRLARWQLAIPILGKVGVMAAASQFSHTMASVLSAGMPILNSLDTAARSVSNPYLSRQIQDIIPGVESGLPLGECMQECREFPAMLAQMVIIGESTGSLEHTLEILAEYYDNEVETLSARALSLLEPIIICIMAVFVVIILFSIYLPMFSLYEAI